MQSVSPPSLPALTRPILVFGPAPILGPEDPNGACLMTDSSSPPVPCDLLVTAAGVVTVDPSDTILRPGALAVSGDRIVAVGAPDELAQRYAPKKRIDRPACWIFPGLINTHNHLWQTMLKGLGDDMGLIDWIRTLLVPTMPVLDDEQAYLASALGALESARSGCTTMLDFMHHFPRLSLYDETIRAFEEIGGSLVMARTVRDNVATTTAGYAADLTLDQQLAHIESLLERHGRDHVWVAPGTVWGMTVDGLKQVRAFADRLGLLITIHMNEVAFDSEESVRRFGMRSVPLLASLGFLQDDVLHAHGVWNDDEDIAILARHRCAVSYNPISNMYLGSGVPPIMKMREAGVRQVRTCGNLKYDLRPDAAELAVGAVWKAQWAQAGRRVVVVANTRDGEELGRPLAGKASHVPAAGATATRTRPGAGHDPPDRRRHTGKRPAHPSGRVPRGLRSRALDGAAGLPGALPPGPSGGRRAIPRLQHGTGLSPGGQGCRRCAGERGVDRARRAAAPRGLDRARSA